MVLLKKIQKLALAVKRLWRQRHYDHDVFAEIAANCLGLHALHASFDSDEIVQWVKTTNALPPPLASRRGFGQPSLTLYQDERFAIDLYFWITQEKYIHDHTFSGAFTSLHGTSLHCTYRFSPAGRPLGRVQTGTLSLIKTELMRPGDVRLIAPGPSFIHRNWHLSCPSVSLAVRTIRDPRIKLETRYWQHHLATSSALPTILAHKRVEMLRFLYRINHIQKEQYAEELILRSDPAQAFWNLREYFILTRDFRKCEKVLGKLKRSSGTLTEYFREALLLERRTQADWETIRGEAPRFLLALLFTQPNRISIEKLIRLYRPSRNSDDFIVDCLREIGETGGMGVEFSEEALAMIKFLSNGMSEGEIVDAMKGTHREWDRNGRQRVREAYSQLRRITWLGPLVNA